MSVNKVCMCVCVRVCVRVNRLVTGEGYRGAVGINGSCGSPSSIALTHPSQPLTSSILIKSHPTFEVFCIVFY